MLILATVITTVVEFVADKVVRRVWELSKRVFRRKKSVHKPHKHSHK